jgi:hypothetical protein
MLGVMLCEQWADVVYCPSNPPPPQLGRCLRLLTSVDRRCGCNPLPQHTHRRREARASLARSVSGCVVESIVALRPSGSRVHEDAPHSPDEALGVVDMDGSAAQVLASAVHGREGKLPAPCICMHTL